MKKTFTPKQKATVALEAVKGIKTINIIPDGGDEGATVQHLKDLGADIVVNTSYSNNINFKNLLSDVDAPTLGINGAGGRAATSVVRTVGEGGTVVTYGGSSSIEIPTGALVSKGISLNGFSLPRWNGSASAQERQSMADELAGLVQNGDLKSTVSKTKFSDFITNLDNFGASDPQSVSATLVTM